MASTGFGTIAVTSKNNTIAKLKNRVLIDIAEPTHIDDFNTTTRAGIHEPFYSGRQNYVRIEFS